MGGSDDEDEPPKVEVTQVVEEDAFHRVRKGTIQILKKQAEWVRRDHSILQLQLRASQTAPLVESKDVSFILTIFPQNFWNK